MIFLHGLGLALLLVCISAAPQTKPITAELPGQGVLEGYQLLLPRAQRVSVFLGIPYAAPPVGRLRFAPPQTEPLVSWAGVRNAAFPTPSCVQRPRDLANIDILGLQQKLYPNSSAISFSEDCLYLNIYVPDGPLGKGQEGWPVVIYLHTTDYSSGSPYLIDPSIFVLRHKVIVVVPSFRLNIFGFLSTGDGYCQGNFGLMDQAAAIGWVQRFISRFNGTASDVTLMGHRGGAASVTFHMIGEIFGFHRAIALSGSALQPGIVKRPDPKVLDDLANNFVCNRKPHSDLMACLRNAEASYLLEKGMELTSWGPVLDANFPNVSSPFLPADPAEVLERGKFTKVPLITGFVESEESYNLPSDLAITKEFFANYIRSSFMEEYPFPAENDTNCHLDEDLLLSAVDFYYAPSRLSDNVLLREKLVEYTTDKNYASGVFKTAELVSLYAQVYMYRFEYKMKTLILDKKENHIYLSHQSDLPFIWGMPYWSTVTPTILWNSVDRRVTDQTMQQFYNFLRPDPPGTKPNSQTFNWETFSTEQPKVLIISKELSMADSSVIDYKSFSFWNEFYPRVQSAAYVCCNATDAGVSLTSNMALITVSSIYAFSSLEIYT